MRTVNEMIEASRKYQDVPIPQVFEKSFVEVEKILRPNEDVLCAFTGLSVQRNNNSTLYSVGVALTNQRLLIGGKIGWLKVSYTAQSFNIENINAISQTWSPIGGCLIIDTLGDDIRIDESSRDAVNKIIADFDATLHSIKANKSGVVVQQTSVADELKKFKDLLDAGILTQEEFDAKKKQLLGL